MNRLLKNVTFVEIDNPYEDPIKTSTYYRAEWRYTVDTVVDNLLEDHLGKREVAQMLKERSVGLFQHELYGEIEEELNQIREMVMSVTPSPTTMNVLQRIHNIQNKITGDENE